MKEQKIVITTDGKITLARLYEDNEVVKRAEAKCCPSDTFDFKTGAELALSRVFEQEKEDIFPLADIKPGYLLACEVEDTGEKFFMTVTMGKVKRVICGPITEERVCVHGAAPKHWWPLDSFDAELRYQGDNHIYRVLAVYGYTFPRMALHNTAEDRELLWERKVAPKVKESIIKVGDKVRVIGNSGPFHFLKLGSEATVLDVDGTRLFIDGPHRDYPWNLGQHVSINDVELI